ncbi:MAG: zinc ribbon domain-containing protein [bacterium]|nr:zinc ribbon domain-containing protein [bacterium]MDO9464659.1 zinc ribbon domain-containing protein [bacterium]
MPTYEYECKDCGHSFELFQSMTEKRMEKCPQCGGILRRLIGKGTGIIFKGSGFYATDYRSSDYNKKAKEETGKAEKKEDKKSTPESKSKKKKDEGKN